MNTQAKQSVLDLSTYLNSGQDLLVIIRTEVLWDESAYQKLVLLLEQVIQDYKDEDTLPKLLLYFFTIDLPLIEKLTTNSYFLKNVPESYDQNSYKESIESGLKTLKKMNEDVFGDIHLKIALLRKYTGNNQSYHNSTLLDNN